MTDRDADAATPPTAGPAPGVPGAGVPAAGVPAAGVPAAGVPAAGVAAAGSSDGAVGRPDVLAAPVWHALTGPHAPHARHAADGTGRVVAARYQADVSPFAAVADPSDPAHWEALATLVEPGERVIVLVVADAGAGAEPWPPAGWETTFDAPGVQMVAATMAPAADADAVALGAGDVPEMLELVGRTRPGPFAARTVELGGYLGIRQGGRLVAMAGRRFAPGGHREISAVCTDADQRGRGLGGRLVRAVAAGIVADGEVPFLHTGAANVTAMRLYERLGLPVARPVRFVALSRRS